MVKSQNEIILFLKDTIASNQEQIEYLTKKLFGTSSEKTQNLDGQYSLFDEAEQEAMPTDETDRQGIRTKRIPFHSCKR